MTHICTQDKRITAIEKTNTSMAHDIKEIKDALLPTEFHPNNGLINNVNNLDGKVDNLSIEVIKMKTWFKIGSSVVVVLIAVIELLIKVL